MAMGVPARYTACYAPGLEPMDFHAVAEAYLDGAWYVIDATRLADRRSLVRIATGRDAADCAFLSYHGGNVLLDRPFVDAVVVPEDDAPAGLDDHFALVQRTEEHTSELQSLMRTSYAVFCLKKKMSQGEKHYDALTTRQQ